MCPPPVLSPFRANRLSVTSDGSRRGGESGRKRISFIGDSEGSGMGVAFLGSTHNSGQASVV